MGTVRFTDETSPEMKIFLDLWNSADKTEYPCTVNPPNSFALSAYDNMLGAIYAVDSLEKQGKLNYDDQSQISAQLWTDTIRALEYAGTTGPVSFDENGDRIDIQQILFYVPEINNWIPSAKYLSGSIEYTVETDVIFYSNTTDVPDLDVRESFDYWSCDDKKLKTDKTGKTVQLHTPDGGSFDDIDSTYYCDAFIDCHNLSDESTDCLTNYIIIFIVFGIITGILMLISVLLIIFVIIWGYYLSFRRLRQVSPFILLLLLVSIIIGYSSVFAWFGKPHPVACGFQPWLLGISSISMISALTVKNFRIWRIFRFPMTKIRISDYELLAYWCITMVPAIFILTLWTIISTPTAKMQDVGDEDHYICGSGGFTGEPGGIIFFSIFAFYGGIVLLFGAFISYVARNAPSQFNESTLLTISIYNLAFLSVVIIPVYFVVNGINPFIAWIIRTTAILYAFTATLVIQFLPIIIGVFIIDKGRNVRMFKSSLQKSSSSKSHKGDESPNIVLSTDTSY